MINPADDHLERDTRAPDLLGREPRHSLRAVLPGPPALKGTAYGLAALGLAFDSLQRHSR
jgi:hypothetical protein